MATLGKFLGASASSLSKIMGVSRTSLASAMGLTMPSNDFVCDFSGGASENETGTGMGLTGADLVLTQVNDVAAASAGWRTVDGVNDYFTATQGNVEAWLKDTTWAFLLHIRNLSNQGNVRTIAMFDAAGGSTGDLQMQIRADNKLYLYISNDAGINTSNTMASSTEYWIACWADGTNKVRIGFKATATQPTAWSDFSSGDRAESSDKTGDFSSNTYNSSKSLFSNAGSQYTGCDVSRVVFSKNGLGA